jgi:hypothetical protein
VNLSRYIAAAGLAASISVLGASGVASASAAAPAGQSGIVTSQELGGDAFTFSTVDLNSSRNTFYLTPLGDSPELENTVALGDLLVQGPQGGHALGAGWVWHDTNSTCPSDTYTLAEGATYVPSEMPIAPADLHAVLVGGNPICKVSVWQYTETHYSSALDEFAVVNSDTEQNQQTVYLKDHPFGNGTDHFLVSGTGVDTSNGTAAGALTSGTQFPMTRCGVTEVAGQNYHVIGGKRLTCDALPWTKYTGTVSGGQATPTNPTTLDPGTLPTTSSNITVSVP